MKTKLVLWGNDDSDNKVVIAAQLRAEDNKVDVWSFHDDQATTELHNALLFEWREGKESAFPASGFKHFEANLTITESFLPEEIKTDQTDLILRAQSEWHFVVLSTKLYKSYFSELEDLKEKISVLEKYDSNTWENLKQFWDKVREQVREKNLSRSHADGLRDQTNKLFSRMKELNSKLNEEFVSKSKETQKRFDELLSEVEAKLEKNENLNKLFDELKKIQKEFRNAKLTKDIRNNVWNRIDALFKAVKVKRFGPEALSGNSKKERLQRRLDGLLRAIGRMENSINRDESELKFQRRKIDSNLAGQLESQIREAKIQMVLQRVNSKKEKLEDMTKTRTQLEAQLEKLEKEQEKRDKKEASKSEETKKAETPEKGTEPPVLVPLTDSKKESAAPEVKEVPDPAPEKTETAKLEVVDKAEDAKKESAAPEVKEVPDPAPEKTETAKLEVVDKAEDAKKESAAPEVKEVPDPAPEKTETAKLEVVDKAEDAKKESAAPEVKEVPDPAPEKTETAKLEVVDKKEDPDKGKEEE